MKRPGQVEEDSGDSEFGLGVCGCSTRCAGLQIVLVLGSSDDHQHGG